MAITYRQLAAEINMMTEEQKDSDVAVLAIYEDEYHPVSGSVKFANSETCDVLDSDHPFIEI